MISFVASVIIIYFHSRSINLYSIWFHSLFHFSIRGVYGGWMVYIELPMYLNGLPWKTHFFRCKFNWFFCTLRIWVSHGVLSAYFGSFDLIFCFRFFPPLKPYLAHRVWWIGAFIVALVLCGSLIKNVYTKLDQSFVSFKEKSTPIWEIPFPAVTICPETKTKKDYLDFTAAYHVMMGAGMPPYNLTDDE